jgi:hypothetical protein
MDQPMNASWATQFRLAELNRGSVSIALQADSAERVKIAKDLNLVALHALSAELTLKPWMDGVEISGRFDAVVEQICAVSLDNFEQPIRGDIDVRAVPASSPQAPQPATGEVDFDPEAQDPPDVLDGDAIDLAGYVVEHLALEIDPFARKPGAEFEYATPEEPESPFAVLKKLKASEP